MRIEHLDLTAFGPFTDLSLNLSGPGVHLVYGPNEAGKTSALAALRSLLYGIPHRTPFGFLHGMSKLRLGAALGNGSGETLEVVRHKRNRNPLTAPDGTPVSEGELLGFLNGVTEEVFTTVFALTLAELQRGGKNLIRGEGDIGQALYSARSGQDTAAVLKALEERQRELYLRTGSVRLLNTALSEYKRIAAERTRASTATEEFLRLQDAVRNEEKVFWEEDDRLKEKEAAYHHWKSLKSALPSLRTRRRALDDLAEITSRGPLADAHAGELLDGLEKDLDLGEQQREREEESLAAHLRELAELHVDERLSRVREDADALVRSVEAVEEAALELTERTRRAGEHRARAERLLRSVRPGADLDDSGVPRVAEPTAERLVELARAHPGLRTRVDDARRQAHDQARALDRARADLADLPEGVEGDALASVVAEFPSALVADLERAYAEEAKAAARFDALVAEFGREAEAAVGDLLSAAVPDKAGVSAHRDRSTRHTAEVENAESALTKASRELSRARGKLESLRAQEDPPTVGELQRARQERDGLWRRIREGDAENGLALDFQSALVKADRLADRLRDSAKAVADRLTLENKVRELEQDLCERGEDLDALTTRGTELEREWEAMWPAVGVPAPAPNEAGAVLDRLDEFRALHGERDERRRSLAVLEESALTLTGQLVDLLTDADAPVEPLDVRPRTGAAAVVVLPQLKALAQEEIDRRQQVAQKNATAQALVGAAEKDLEKALGERERAEEEEAAWSREWDGAATAAGFAPGADPEEVRAGLDLLKDAAAVWDQALTEEHEADRARQRIAEFDLRLAAVFDTCGRVPSPERTERVLALEELHREAEANAATAKKREELADTVAADEAALVRSRAARDAARERLDALLAENGVDAPAGLREAVSRAREAEKARDRVRQAEEQLAEHGEVEALEERARHLTDAEIAGRVEQATRDLAEVRGRRDRATVRHADARNALARIDGTAEAARLAEEEAALTERIADQAEEYVKVTLARRMLLDRMEEYRKHSQDPVLRRAEELFAFLTLGEFPRLRPDLDENGVNVLRVERRNGDTVNIGGLSEGTADQLYLALRLASLDHYAEAGQTMPFIVDDVFMTFDDERGAAALQVLDGMSDRFQVVVFTHHAHLADLAERSLPSGRAHVHELLRYTPAARGGADGAALPEAASEEVSGRRAPGGSGERICKSCEEPFTHTGRGRPPVRCPDCRG
ncbi:AAA family ATPase [Nocardiopsis sp. N85]|uniref:YhaN family protein n=1 Tax=Nocardiopsis sp. N85 TaxID=3029400 RepID=UPI00237FB453|nr:YhaN family protein [Nocardiopsis sp. N85]MDE3719938.1 AAA family ATPase [Nocardiopsis sp. N85]